MQSRQRDRAPLRFLSSCNSFCNDRRLAIFLAIAVALALAATILVAPTPVSLDGPSHIYSALVLRHLIAGDPLSSRYFRLNSLLLPNWLAPALLALTVTHSSDRWNAGVMMTVVLALTIGALYFLVRRSSGEPRAKEHELFVVVALSPFAISAFLFYGFWDFLISTALCFFAAGLLYTPQSTSTRALIAALVLLGFWAHPVPVLLTAFFPLWKWAAALVRSSSGGYGSDAGSDHESDHDNVARPAAGSLRAGSLWASLLRDVWPWAVATLLIVRFTVELIRLRIGSDRTITGGPPLSGRLASFLRTDALASIAPSATMGGFFLLLIAALFTGAVVSGRYPAGGPQPGGDQKRFRFALCVFGALLMAAYLVIPDRIGNGTVISGRLLLMLASTIAVLGLSSTLSANARYLRLCAVLAALVTGGTCAEYMIVSWRMAPAVRELKDATSQLTPRSTMLLLSYRLTPDCGNWWPLYGAAVPERHWGLLGAMKQDLVVLNDYESATRHFPTEYRDLRYVPVENEFTFRPKQIRAWSEALASAQGVDYVVSWGVPSPTTLCSAWVEPPLQENLQRGFVMESESHQASRVQIWRRRGSTGESAAR